MQGARLSASLEDYLEAIFQIIEDREAVRSKDIAERLGVTTSSVCGALRLLSNLGLVNHEPYGIITLTPEGRRLGAELSRAHEVLRDFLTKVLAVEPEKADRTACAIEHTIPSDVLERFVGFLEFMDLCPHAGATWIEGFGFHCEDEGNLHGCERCANPALDRIRRHRLDLLKTREKVAPSLAARSDE